MAYGLTAEDLRRRFAAAAPPSASLYGDEGPRPDPAQLRPAAVLVPIVDRRPAPTVLFTRRAAHLKDHSGQVSFPGGRVHAGDASPEATALREAREEIGLDPARVEVLGRLSETLVLQSAFRLTPWVASVPYPYPYVADPREVDEILHVPLSELQRPGAHRVEKREAYGMNLDVHYFDLGGEVLWGATARITWELLGVWRTA